MVLDGQTLVLNRNWVPVNVVSVLKALCKLYDGSARALHPEDYSLHDFSTWASVRAAPDQPVVRTATISIPVPEVIVLAGYEHIPERKVAFSRANLYRRDNFTCQYCGARPGSTELNIDHVLPRSRGGQSTWSNCVVACIRCNSRKADRTPAECGMALRRKPVKPNWTPKLILARVRYRASWEKFLSDAYWNVELEK